MRDQSNSGLGGALKWRAVIAAALVAACTATAHAAVFGTDRRGPVPPQYQSVHGKIGLLFNNHSRTVCSAFCVAPNVIATAAHCLFRTNGEAQPKIADFWFVRAYDKDREYSRIAGFSNSSAAQNVLAGETHLNIRPPIDAASDWALVRLSRPACHKGFLKLQPMPADQVIEAAHKGQVFQISYHRDYPDWRAAYSKPCEVERQFGKTGWAAISRDFANPDSLLLHKCDTGGASSGSPMLVDGPAGPAVIGINVGTYVQSKVLVRDGQVSKQFDSDTIANTAVNIAALHANLNAFITLDTIASGPRLKELQHRLKALNYYQGVVDGGFGEQTRAAILAYERASGLPARGLATEEVLASLHNASPSSEKRPIAQSRRPAPPSQQASFRKTKG